MITDRNRYILNQMGIIQYELIANHKSKKILNDIKKIESKKEEIALEQAEIRENNHLIEKVSARKVTDIKTVTENTNIEQLVDAERFECEITIKLVGGILILAEVSEDRKDELMLLNNLIKKIGKPIVLEREFKFPILPMTETSKQSAIKSLDKLIFWLEESQEISSFLVLSESDIFTKKENTVFSHTLSSMQKFPELRKELWDDIKEIR